MASRTFFIHTIGCQMNHHDAELMALELSAAGFAPAPSAAAADLVVVNTCSVRGKAEQKAFSLIGQLEAGRRPGRILVVAGCVAQQEGERLLARAPGVDILLGTGAVTRLRRAVRRLEADGRPVVDLGAAGGAGGQLAAERPPGRPVRFITIMRGCDNFCAYCIVPHVRGREASRPPEEIVREAERLAAGGVREVTLLGQNVNSYGRREGYGSFTGLLERLNGVAGLRRIRFTTSHPKDLTAELIGAFARLEKLCPHIHLPVQSGSDRILERMNRRYTAAQYLEKVDRLRAARPGIAITSDMIVGFPGETEADFEATLDLIRRVEFDGLFAFVYSDRPHTPARGFDGKVPAAEARARLKRLLALQETYSLARNRALEGTVQEVLAEGFSKRKGRAPGAPGVAPQWTGRTPGNKVVNFHRDGRRGGRPPAPGELIAVRIERALPHSLLGVTVDPPAWPNKETDQCCARPPSPG
jgi:tRNA-2-methylthio-N6-dimethylallyladenosine synthase